MSYSNHSNNEELVKLLSAYFTERGSFLAQVIRADLKNLPHLTKPNQITAENAHQHHNISPAINGNGVTTNHKYSNHHPVISVTSSAQKVTPLPKPVSKFQAQTLDVESILIALIAEQTGYPADSISLDAKLLDDLNMDSIKASELIASATKTCNIAGIIDPSSIANASLQEIIQVIHSTMGGMTQTTPSIEHNSETLPQLSPSTQAERELTSLLLSLVEEQTGFPKNTLSLDLRLLDDLNLDSIKAAELIAIAAKKTGISGKIDLSTLANSTLGELVTALQQNQVVSRSEEKYIPQPQKKIKENYSTWVRNFAIEYIPQEISEVQTNWSQTRVLIVSEEGDRHFCQTLKDKLQQNQAQVEIITYDRVNSLENSQQSSFTHYLAILPQTPSPQGILPLAQMTAHVKSIATLAMANTNCCLTYVQFGGGHFGSQGAAISPELCCAGAFARSLHLERPHSRVRAIDFPQNIEYSQATELVIQEMSTKEAIATVGYDEQLVRLVPQSSLQQPATYQPRSLSWSAEDVILVTGGAKGITAECALALAKNTGVKMALVGRSQKENPEVMQTLKRFQDEGLTCQYYPADITNSQAVVELVQKITAELGLITGIIHGAGLNTPRRVEQVTLEAAQKEVSPKILGAHHLLQALATTPPKLVMAFSSIIGVTGMPGNAWYAFANESLTLLLHQFQAQNPHTQVLSLAYSVWDEVGMGARMGSIKTLDKMGIGAIPLKEGVDRFLQLFEYDPGVLQVIISARLGSLDTWLPVQLDKTNQYRFIERVLHVEPHVELTVRTHLSLDKDLYIKDHVWRGSYLFPTVFGLEAMAQATAYVTGETDNKIARIENISLHRPIVVHPTHGVEIEIHAEVMEALPNGELAVKVSIRTEKTAFTTDHFAATLIIGNIKPGATIDLPLGKPLAIDPQTDLYGDLLFQGERFQRMGAIYSLNQHQSIFRSYAITSETELVQESFSTDMESYILLGDPYLRDVLLQSLQLNISQHTCLPISIGKIEFFQNPHFQEDDRIVTVVSIEKGDKECIGEVFVSDKQGNILEKLTDYRVRIMEENLSNPTPEELANPEKRDANILQDKLNTAFATWELKQPGVGLGYAPNLQVLPKEQRRQQEKPIVAKAIQAQLELSPEHPLDFEITTLASGKPQLVGASVAGLYVSLSHCDRYCLSTVGYTPQGVDIEIITHRTPEKWLALLSLKHSAILNKLTEKGESLDIAGTRIWSSIEAVRKALNGTHPELSIVKYHQDSILLKAKTVKGNYLVVTQPIKLTRHPERMVAILVPQEQPVSSPSSSNSAVEVFTEDSNNSHIQEDYLGQVVYEKRFQLSFKDSGSLSRKVYFSQYFSWIGKIREFALESIAPQMLSDFFSRDCGMVTNAVSMRVLGEATSYDTIQARVWLGEVVESTFDAYIEFCKVLPDESLERIALADVKSTWVHLESYGVPAQVPLPPYFQKFLDKFTSKEPVSLDLRKPETFSLPPLPTPLAKIDTGAMLYESPPKNRYGNLLYLETYQTTLEESNLVGNVYYGNYFIWQGRTLDLFLYSVAPEYLRVSNPKGELICLYTRMDFLEEAMPFDKILVLLYIKSVSECGAVFNFEFFRQESDGKRKKLHIGQQEAMWACRDQDGNLVPTPWPKVILAALTNTINR
ncbi:MAG: SDR family NAD(P)-dependent oxidoreductase [Okeania sp. SIO3B5]|uniref:SDR family NAD(P)-dependent oxidoreductase n=1 Tax=Okeania sp. SIO3B5 TaxID=2607811 RepID=UPI0014003D25|nr:SDR family NAD(P)-dependent oxidoreductase [Okeania sp. SIO3B5]NEO56352.1 SDR family NAD(P)-dependent oxidoreductase [Okeania sp. SIO3B5]